MNYRNIPNVLLENLYGIEIGALNKPYQIPENTKIDYLDVRTHEELQKIFKEVKDIVHNEYVFDISREAIPDELKKKYDFVIANHVLEHVPNPIFALKNMFDLINDNGYAIISVPDKNFSYDKNRSITPFEHVLADYYLENFDLTTDHIVDFLIAVHPEAFVDPKKEKLLNAFNFLSEESEYQRVWDSQKFLDSFNFISQRNEHLHVWDSNAFRQLLDNVISLLELKCKIIYEASGETNFFEYFCIIKFGQVDWHKLAMLLLPRLYKSRLDLKATFKDVDFINNTNTTDFINWVKKCECAGDTELHIAKQYIKYL